MARVGIFHQTHDGHTVRLLVCL